MWYAPVFVMFSNRILAISRVNWRMSVSYTHLDVYKRQPLDLPKISHYIILTMTI